MTQPPSLDRVDAGGKGAIRSLRILHLEDSLRDAELICDRLESAGLIPEIVRVDNKADFEMALGIDSFALILCDYNLPGYDGLSALKEARERRPLTPIIMISGSLGEDQAVECLHWGATDYVLKQRFERFIPAVRRALREAEELRARRQAEAELRESEEQHRLLFQSNPLPMWVYDVETLRFLAVNSTAVSQYGFSETEFMAMTIRDIRPPDDLGRLGRALSRMEPGKVTGAQWRHRRRNGEIIDVEVSSAQIPFGGRTARLVLANDITDRLEAERTSRRLAAQMHQLLEHSPAVIYALTVDRDTVALRFASENISRLLGFTVAETLSYDWWLSRLHPKDREVAAASVAETLSRGVSRTEYRVQHKDGTYRWIDDNRRLVLDATGVTELVGAWTDITERKELENQFLRAQRLESIGSLAGGIAHDLNNIFMPILMGVSTIKRLEHGERTRKAAETIEQCVRRGTDLVKQVLLFARGADGSRVDLDLGSVVAEVEAIAHSTFPGNVRFVTSVAADLPRFQGNPTQLMQVLLNLCVNARDALPAGGEIKVTAGVEQIDGSFAREHGGTGGGRYVVLEVIDDGTGMSPAILGRIFEPFFTTKLAGQGTGLGLSTSLGIVRGHRGFVTVSSEVGIGSSFKVYVPADAGSAETAAASVRSDQYLPRGSGELILVVEDETAVLDMTRQALEASGYEVFTAENGARALDVFERERPNIDLVITDMVMPVMDGATLIRQLRQIDSGVRIIATSGWDQTVQSANAMAGGAQRFLAKPFTAAVMLRTVFDVLRPSG